MPIAEVGAEAIRLQVERVLKSPGFARNQRRSRFLSFLVERHLERRDDELKESVIGTEIFGRQPDYDPKKDSIVRAEARRLRALLDEYYSGEGIGDALLIELPKGGYVPVFREAEKPAPEAPSRQHFLRPVGIAAGVVSVAAAVAVIGWWHIGQVAPIPIAVLPLVDLSQDPSGDYFADGLTAEIIRNLSIIDGLAVRSQTSSFEFKGRPRDVREAGQQLQADYILEGSVLRAGSQLRINTQLVRVRDDSPIWSGRYDRELTDILAIQDEISRGIVNGLRLKLGRGQRRYETGTEAYDLYLRARASGTIVTPGSVISLFEEAIAKDPSLAPAYAGLAASYAQQTIAGATKMADRPDELARMRAAAEKALELDPLLPEAYSALGTAYARDAQWEQSERSFRRAIEIAPNLLTMHASLAEFVLFPLGRIEEAVREWRIEVRLDPLSPWDHFWLADALIAAGRYEEAADECQKVFEDFRYGRDCLGRARLGQGRTAEAIRDLANANRWGYLAYAYAKAGRREEAEKLMIDGPRRYKDRGGPFQRAIALAGLGDKDRTIANLEQMADFGAVRIGMTLNGPEFAFVRGDPRVKALRKKVGLPD